MGVRYTHVGVDAQMKIGHSAPSARLSRVLNVLDSAAARRRDAESVKNGL